MRSLLFVILLALPLSGAQETELKDADESSNSAEDTSGQTSADQSVTSDSTKQSEDNGSTDARIVAPIKISKNKRKNSKNWSIVSQKSDKSGSNVSNELKIYSIISCFELNSN